MLAAFGLGSGSPADGGRPCGVAFCSFRNTGLVLKCASVFRSSEILKFRGLGVLLLLLLEQEEAGEEEVALTEEYEEGGGRREQEEGGGRKGWRLK